MSSNSAVIDPDLGLLFLKRGTTSDQLLYFYEVELTEIDYLDSDLHTTTLKTIEDNITYAASFDFDNITAKAIIAKLSSTDQTIFLQSIKGELFPFQAILPKPITINVIKCQLGEIQRGVHDSFVPFVIKEII